MTAIPAGWGFTDDAALARHAKGTPAPPVADRTQKRWVTPERLAAYAARLESMPTIAEIMCEFSCCSASAINHRRKLAPLLAQRAAHRGAAVQTIDDDELPPCVGEKMRDITRGRAPR